MNPFRPIAAAFTKVKNFLWGSKFEAARLGSSARTDWGQTTPQDARIDYDSATREVLVERSRRFEMNNGIFNRLLDIFEQFTVGTGLPIIPSSTDEEWNVRHTRSWESWQNYCDLTSLHSFSTLQSQIARNWFVDGEVFILKTFGEEKIVQVRGKDGKERPQPLKRPRIQMIAAHRIATPPEQSEREGKTIIDGVEVDKRGRPIAYWIKNVDDPTSTEQKWTKREARDVIHVFEPHRPGEYRGRPFAACVLNDLHDLNDLQQFEMHAAKEASSTSNVLENAVGEFPATAALVRGNITQTTQDGAGNDTTVERTRWMQKIFGTRSIALKKGEKFTQFETKRPSVVTQQFWEYQTSKVCAGVGISKLLVFPWSIQGTVARADLDIAAGFFRSRAAIIAWASKEVYLFYTQWAIKNEEDSSDPPADGSWTQCDYQPPRACNVDVGRNSAADLAELEAGATTFARIYGPLGCNWRQEIRQRFVEEKYINDLAARPEFAGVGPERIRASVAAHLERMKAEQDKRELEDAAA